MPSFRIVAVLALLGLTLTGAVVPQLLPVETPVPIKPAWSLGEYLPRSSRDWRGEDEPIADTEALRGAVNNVLNFDDGVLRKYRRGSDEFSVWVAYWKPGKMPSREIAFHIPDKCWTAAGLKRTAANYSYVRCCGGQPLSPGQYREFEAPSVHQYVVYWHIFDSRTIIYNPDGSPSDLSMLTDLWRRGLRQRGEQFFIRISSPLDLDLLWNDPGFQEVIELLASLGPGRRQEIVQF